MADPFVLSDFRSSVDKEYVGVSPNSSSVKPVHIADAALKEIDGQYCSPEKLKRLALVCNAKGQVFGNTLDSVYDEMVSDESLDADVSKASFQSMRNVMQKLVSADKAVYVVNKLEDSMISYTAGSKYFLTNSAIFSDAGILMGSLVKQYCPELAEYIKSILDTADDPITSLFSPVLKKTDEEMTLFTARPQDDLPDFQKPNKQMEWFISGIKEGGNCLVQNFKKHSNQLTQLRIFNLFIIFHLIRYLTSLEAFYCGEEIRPFLLDFTGLKPSESSVARASELSYTQMYRSLNRFYAWAYSEKLKDFTISELMDSVTPTYIRDKPLSKGTKEEYDALWNMAKDRAKETESGDDKRIIFGETIYDLLALEASSHPINYLKALGTAAGILYPPDKAHPNKRFVPSQDVLEMLLRSCVEPGAVITETDIRSRLWQRFGIIIGGRSDEIKILQNNGAIMQVSEDALEANFASFAETLESMDFAEKMADGILKIRLGGTYDD